MKNQIIRISLLFIVFMVLESCLSAKNKNLDIIYTKQIELYKKQNNWNSFTQKQFLYKKRILDSLIKSNTLNISDFNIIEETSEDTNILFVIQSGNLEICFYKNGSKWENADNSFVNEKVAFKEYTGLDFREFIENNSQQDLENCCKIAPVANRSVIVYSRIKNKEMVVKRFFTCDYAKYFNLGKSEKCIE